MLEKLYFCHRCEFNCSPDYNNYSNVCPECDSKLYLIEGTAKELDKYIDTHTGKMDDDDDEY